EPGFGTPSNEKLPPPSPHKRTDEGSIVFVEDSYPARTIVHLSEPFADGDGTARFALSLEPGERWRLVVGVQPQPEGVAPLPAGSFGGELDEERRRAAESHAAWRASAPRLRAGWDDLVHTWNRSLADIASLRMHIGPPDVGRLLAAGAPWFMTVFGRDTIV